MIAHLKKLIKGEDHYYLIGVYTIEDKTHYEFLEVALEVDELKIIAKESIVDIEKSFKELLKKDHPILLHFDGDNVISRTTENKQGYRNNIVFKMNPDDFYFYEYHRDDTIFASLSRRQFVDDTIQLFNKNDKFIVHLSIGPFVVSQLVSILKNETEVFSSFHSLKLSEDGITSFEKTEEQNHQVVISEEKFSQKEIGLMATFLNFKQGNDNILFNDTLLLSNRDEQTFRKRFKQMSVFTIAFIMMALLVGHQLLNYYVNALAEKESRYSISQQTLMEVNELREERALKEKILETSGVIDANYMTQYFVEIGNNVPDDITITSIDAVPALKKIKPNEKINMDTKIINITGESYTDGDFNTLMKSLNAISWVKKVDIINYVEEKSGNTFLIKITK
nr:PilN domain-containing protein [uncultured Psychroserpens sp.]